MRRRIGTCDGRRIVGYYISMHEDDLRTTAGAIPAFGIRNVSHETRELYRTQGRLQLGLLATLAQYERELINERVRAGVQAAKARGVKFGRQPPKPETVEAKVKIARQLLAENKTAREVAETIGWSRSSLYRYLKEFGAEQSRVEEVGVRGRGRSAYAARKTLPARTARGTGG